MMVEYIMTVLEIRKYPDPILKQVSGQVEKFDNDLSRLLDNMAETMYAADGIGLAAPQVGVGLQALVLDISKENNQIQHYINPTIISASGETASEEGCLSIPEYRDTVTRNATVVVTAFDKSGRQFQVEADGLLAICLQHEIDHLNGILFIDRLSRLKREMFKRWHKKRVE